MGLTALPGLLRLPPAGVFAEAAVADGTASRAAAAKAAVAKTRRAKKHEASENGKGEPRVRQGSTLRGETRGSTPAAGEKSTSASRRLKRVSRRCGQGAGSRRGRR